MTEHRDHDIAERLAEWPAPEHGSSFWAGVRDELERDAEGGPVRLDEVRIRRNRSPRWLLAAAAAVVVVVAAGVFLSADEDPVDVTSDPTLVTPPETTEPPDAGALRPSGEPTRSSGQVVAVSPDGEWVYVADIDPDGGRGCEGAPRHTLFVQPADGPADGQRRLASDAPLDATGGTRLVFGPDGSVAVHTFCEGFTSEFGTGVVADDGTIADFEPLAVADDIPTIVDLDWARPGVLVLSTYDMGGGDVPADPAGRRLVEFDLRSGHQTAIGPEGVIYVEVTDSGQLVTRDDVGTVRVGDEIVGSEGSVHGLAVSNDGRFVVTAGDNGVTVYDRETGADERIFDDPAFSLAYLASGDVVFSTRDSRPVARVMVVHLGEIGHGGHAVSTLFSDADAGGHLTYDEVAPDGSRLWVSYLPRTDPGSDTNAEWVSPVLLSQPLTR